MAVKQPQANRIGRIPIHGADRRGARIPEYTAWLGMKHRCCNPESKNYADYGGRGITVCDRWIKDFTTFLADMGLRPSETHSLDRIDNSKGYAPSNCQWATRKQQNQNKRNVKLLTHNGLTLPLPQWSPIVGVSPRRLRGRLEAGWSIAATLSKPLGPTSARSWKK